MKFEILQGDCRDVLKTLPDESVNCCVTSPPYFGLRSYLPAGHPLKSLEIGQERTPDEYVATMVGIFREVRRVLRKDGTLWLNLGDSYCNTNKMGGRSGGKHTVATDGTIPSAAVRTRKGKDCDPKRGDASTGQPMNRNGYPGLKPKDLIGIPWRVALALQADGWWLRSDIIWAKANCMPESITSRPTRSHEYIFLLAKSEKYFYDHEAIKEPCIYNVDGTGTESRKARANGNKLLPTAERNGIRPGKNHQMITRDHPEISENSKFKNGGYKNSVNFDGKNKGAEKQRGHSRRHDGLNGRWDAMEKDEQCTGMRNKRDVWTVAPANYPEAHFATFPPVLIRPCIRAGCPMGGTVLDPFAGSGTTGQVAIQEGRNAILIDLNPEYIPLIESRTNVTPGMAL